MFSVIDISLTPDTVVALITLAGVVMSLTFAGYARRDAAQVNRAVNNSGPGEPTLREMVIDIHKSVAVINEWKSSYDGGPLDDGRRVEEFVNGVGQLGVELQQVKRSVAAVAADVRRYGCPVRQREADTCLQEQTEGGS